MTANLILAVDPGLDGAFAFWNPDLEQLEVFDMPKFAVKRNGKEKRELDEYQIANLIDSRAADVKRCVIELVGSMPNQGIASAFTFGDVTGVVRGIIKAHLIPVERVAPGVWKRYMGVTADKDSSRRKASALLPHCAKHWPLAKHDGRAEAALLALYAERFL